MTKASDLALSLHLLRVAKVDVETRQKAVDRTKADLTHARKILKKYENEVAKLEKDDP